jgi:hypothetical protein
VTAVLYAGGPRIHGFYGFYFPDSPRIFLPTVPYCTGTVLYRTVPYGSSTVPYCTVPYGTVIRYQFFHICVDRNRQSIFRYTVYGKVAREGFNSKEVGIKSFFVREIKLTFVQSCFFFARLPNSLFSGASLMLGCCPANRVHACFPAFVFALLLSFKLFCIAIFFIFSVCYLACITSFFLAIILSFCLDDCLSFFCLLANVFACLLARLPACLLSC